MEIQDSEQYIGSSKFDKLRRIIVIKPVADRMGLKDGDEVSFYSKGTEIILRKRITNDVNQDALVKDILNEVTYNMNFYYDEKGNPSFSTNLSELYSPDLVEKLDESHRKQLFQLIFDEVAKKIMEYSKTQ